jgi:hypothetical protein
MYTLEQLQQKTFKELKEIGWQLNVLPAGDRRCRQNWIEAIVGVKPPLLELLDVSPGVEVEPVEEAIAQVREIPPCDRASKFSLYPADFDPLSDIDEDREAYYQLYGVEREDDDNNPDFRYWLHGNNRRLYGGDDDDDDDDELAAQPIAQTVENSPGVEIEPVAEAIEIQAQEPIAYPRAQRLIDLAANAKTSPSIDSQGSIKLGDWVKVIRKPRLATGVKRGEIFQVLRVNTFNGALMIENPHENPKLILSARIGLLDPSEVCLVPRSNRPDTPVFIDLVNRNFPDRLQELLQNPSGVSSEPIKFKFGRIISKPTTKPIKDGLITRYLCRLKPIAQTVDSPGVEIEPVTEAIEIQATEPIESKFGRIVYPKPAAEPIAQTVENSPGVSFDVEEFQQAHVAEIDAYVASFTDDRPPNRGSGDRGRIEPKVTQSALKQTGKKSIAHQLLELFKASALIIPDSPAAESEPKVTQSVLKQTETSPSSEAIPVGIALSDRFLARYAPPQPEQIHFKVDADGQLSLLDFELSGIEEPPDPDDYDCMFSFWAAYDAWCDRSDESFEQCTELDSQCTELDSQCTELDSQCTEPIQIELASMVEWAPCLDEYEPETIETIETSSITLEISSMLILSEGCANESFDTCDFSIPTFDVWCDRPIDTDEPPDTGIFARRPLPKPPSFPPMAVVAGDRANRIKKFARGATFLSGRAPPGGDASF